MVSGLVSGPGKMKAMEEFKSRLHNNSGLFSFPSPSYIRTSGLKKKGLKILHFHLYGHFKSTWQVAKCCCKEIRHQQMTNPYDVYEKSTYRKVSQMRGWDSGGDFAVSFGCESCFSSETQSFCVAQSKSVPNMVVIMRIFRKKWLRSSIGRSQGVRIPASLSEWGGEPV